MGRTGRITGQKTQHKNDLTCRWITQAYGNEWESWRAYADEWLHSKHQGLQSAKDAIRWFVECYLVAEGLPSEPGSMFLPNADWPDPVSCMKTLKSPISRSQRNNTTVEFIDWVITKDFSEPNDHGLPVPLVKNPFQRIKQPAMTIESVWNPLPYKYIKELRNFLCPNPQGCFNDWIWAHQQSGQQRSHGKGPSMLGDWFEVDPSLIDTDDPDCVWYTKEVLRRIQGQGEKKFKIYLMWSPVRAMVLYLKLQLPLRTYQVRMLDSGEADTWRYRKGQWQFNSVHSFVEGSITAPVQRGVFRRIRSPDTGEYHAGFYINTNKTADQNKDAVERGYLIPWEHLEVLYWLEKLRNWQEKYNPIGTPTSWSTLQKKHLGQLKSWQVLSQMGSSSFLFRNASATKNQDRVKPIHSNAPTALWYQLLQTLEEKLYERGETLANGSPLRLVQEYPKAYPNTKVATEFPLHSLRVSLLTHYAMDGAVPLPVLSKLLAGHSRILMTLYYSKITPAVMHEKMRQAEATLDATANKNLKLFLKDAELRQIKAKCVYSDEESLAAALVNRNPIGWEERHIGLCLAGGNTVKSDEVNTLAGCWNGGECLKDANDPYHRVHGPVPHGPENCVRCRWFITEAQYLDALRAHFNNLSYRAQLAAKLAAELEQDVEALEDARCEADASGHPFTRVAELQQAERRYEKQLVDADEYAKDMRACFTLIHRLIAIEMERQEDDNRQKLVAAGTLHDIHQPIALLETQSELLQLSGICEDAEIYPDLTDELRKTPAIKARAGTLNLALMRDGYQPVFLAMDEKMQLILGNALMRAMAQQACTVDWQIEGMKRVCGAIEAERSLKQLGLLQDGIKALETQWGRSVTTLRQLLDHKVPELEIIYGNDDD